MSQTTSWIEEDVAVRNSRNSNRRRRNAVVSGIKETILRARIRVRAEVVPIRIRTIAGIENPAIVVTFPKAVDYPIGVLLLSFLNVKRKQDCSSIASSIVVQCLKLKYVKRIKGQITHHRFNGKFSIPVLNFLARLQGSFDRKDISEAIVV